MRLLFVCTDADVGGAERLLAVLAKYWPQEDTLRLVVLMSPGSLSDQLESAFDEVVYLGFPPTSRNLAGMVRSLERQIQDFKPALISSHLFHADLVTALARTRTPKTTTVHTHGLGPNDHILTRLIARAVGILSFRFSAVIPSSDSPDMARFMASLKMRNVKPAILNGADIAAGPCFDVASRSFLSVARNHPVKGHKVLFEAFARIASFHPEWRLRAIGPAVVPENTDMRAAIDESGAASLLASGRITLEGPTASPEEALKTGAALVISSLYGETLPLIGAEAAGVGVPVITTNVGNCAEFADDERFVVAPDSVDDLAQALDTYAGLTDAERKELSVAARTRAEMRYMPQHVAAAYCQAYAELATS